MQPSWVGDYLEHCSDCRQLQDQKNEEVADDFGILQCLHQLDKPLAIRPIAGWFIHTLASFYVPKTSVLLANVRRTAKACSPSQVACTSL
jgi:hypothetical protein